jgi:hypothetical protein
MQFIFLLQTFFAKMIHTATIRDYATTMVHVNVSRVGMKNWIAQVCIFNPNWTRKGGMANSTTNTILCSALRDMPHIYELQTS